MYPHPFSVGYWRTAANELKDVRKLTFAALCIALCMALAAIPSVPLWGGAKITWGFLARAVCAWVCGPVLGVVFAVAEDLLSFFIPAPVAFRADRAQKVYEKEAGNMEDFVRKKDKKRAAFYNYFSQNKWGDARHYHLAISSVYGVDFAVEVLKHAAESFPGGTEK